MNIVNKTQMIIIRIFKDKDKTYNKMHMHMHNVFNANYTILRLHFRQPRVLIFGIRLTNKKMSTFKFCFL